MLGARRFQFRPVLTIFTALALGVLVTLGMWQLHRLDWKRALVAQVEARVSDAPISFADAVRRAEAGEDMEYTPVYAEGVFANQFEARVFGTYESAPGAYYFAPLEEAGQTDSFIYVNRGFAPQGVEVDVPSRDETCVYGLFRAPEKAGGLAGSFRPIGKSTDGLWFARDARLFAADAGIAASPYYIDQAAVEGRAWPKGGTTRLSFNNRHLEYALTWFGLAAALCGVWVAFSYQKP